MREELLPGDIEVIRPTEMVRTVLDIDFEAWREKYGIRHWGFDIEGTIARGQSSYPMIPDEFIDHLRDARCRGAIDTLFLLTNRRIKVAGRKLGDKEYAEGAKTLVGADFSFVRSQGGLGKPNKDIMLEALETMKIDPSETAYVGDKLTADVRVANEVGLGRSLWVNPRHGVQDRPLDWLIRRPLELVHASRLGMRGLPPGAIGQIIIAVTERNQQG